jgi:predicted transcriptional regulator
MCFHPMADLLNIVISSDKRKSLLILLNNGPHTWDEIKTKLNVTASGMLPQIKILEEEGLIVHKGKTYYLTDVAKPIVHYLMPLDDYLDIIESQKQFWQQHDVGALPFEFQIRIGEIKDPKIIETSLEESFEPHSQFLDSILKSNGVAGISPFVHPIYPRFFLSLAQEGRDVRLILTKNAFTKIKKEYYEMLISGLKYDNARLWIYEHDLKFAHIVTDTYFSISLFCRNGIFDSQRDMFSSNPSAIRWGVDLFNHYLRLSSPVNKEGLYSDLKVQ